MQSWCLARRGSGCLAQAGSGGLRPWNILVLSRDPEVATKTHGEWHRQWQERNGQDRQWQEGNGQDRYCTERRSVASATSRERVTSERADSAKAGSPGDSASHGRTTVTAGLARSLLPRRRASLGYCGSPATRSYGGHGRPGAGLGRSSGHGGHGAAHDDHGASPGDRRSQRAMGAASVERLRRAGAKSPSAGPQPHAGPLTPTSHSHPI